MKGVYLFVSGISDKDGKILKRKDDKTGFQKLYKHVKRCVRCKKVFITEHEKTCFCNKCKSKI